jgi:hypothetical protein
MIEPVYVLENGKRIPYVPIEIKDHREAYAATLHVLFKHVADFHICVVKTFSKKYGIPEDDIMQTIQESDEFKHMQVDPVLHHDGLGYLSPAHQQQHQQQQEPQAPAQQQQQEQQAPAPQAPAPQAPAQQQQQQQEPVAKKRIVKKKSPANPAPANPAPVVAVAPDPVVPDPVVAVVAVAPDPVVPDPVVDVVAAAPDPVGAVVEKRKVIRKKAPIPPVTMDMTTERNDPPTKPADAHTPPPNTPKKIIRKKS